MQRITPGFSMHDTPPAIFWFRRDLRLSDNPALHEAAAAGAVLPVYILDDIHAGTQAMGAASRVWLHHSLRALNHSLGGALRVYRGDPLTLLPALAQQHGARAVYWNRCYEPWRIRRDTELKDILRSEGIAAHSSNGSLLWEPWEIKKSDGTPYKVFTPFYRNGCLNAAAPRRPLPAPQALRLLQDTTDRQAEDALRLLPTPRWDIAVAAHWHIGEAAAQQRLAAFLDESLGQYRQARDFPSLPHVSRLSPHLHFGEISPHQAWHAAQQCESKTGADDFCRELGWREFSYHLLYHVPTLPEKNLQSKFDAFDWRDDAALLACWQRGLTGYPIVDAGMRELWQTGYMHNRVRMIVASFLVKNLRLHWRHGARWFWDCLFDADLANNSASWQWVAGCGADAAPYFRIFNPVTQGQKFDPDGTYTRHFLPELVRLPSRYLFSPWEAPAAALQEAGVTLGENYPYPVVNLKASREAALAALGAIS